MGKIDYESIYARNKHGWYDMTEEPQKYEALLAGHYSDSNHFVYELLQNAEDEKADVAVIEYYRDKLVFYHNGLPFDEDDVRGVSSMLMGTKDRDDAQTIGRFGMGFKSVFKYTYQPEIYSDDEAFYIKNYLLPIEMKDAWDYQLEKKKIKYQVESEYYYPFIREEHLTKIVIPFQKRNIKGELQSIAGHEVLQKLESLNGTILLFLSHIKNLFWIDKTTGRYAMISMSVDEKDQNLYTCRISGSAYGKKEQISRYLKFSKRFDHAEMKSAEVSVAYKVNSVAYNINDMDGTDIVVYFPTRDHTNLPFLIHGSFETAVSREKLMTPSAFNSDLFDELGNLIADSMLQLKNRKLITQVFLRRVLLAAFKDEEINNTVPRLKEKLTKVFLDNELLPDRDGNYCSVKEVELPVPFRIAEFKETQIFAETFKDVSAFVNFNNEREANFTEYFLWLRDDLKLKCLD